MRKGSGGIVINAQDEELKSKMKESGAPQQLIETVVKVAADQGTTTVAVSSSDEANGNANGGSGS
jgi:hypothetical protein